VSRRLTALLAPALAGTFAAAALAATPTIVVTPNEVHRGHTVRVHGAAGGCPAGDQVTLLSRAFSAAHEFAGVPAVHARVGAHGGYSVTTRIPAARHPGRYSVSARCGGGNFGVRAPLRVLA
jgi:hypothetical protein